MLITLPGRSHCKTLVKLREIHSSPKYSKFIPHNSIFIQYKAYQNHVLEHSVAKFYGWGLFCTLGIYFSETTDCSFIPLISLLIDRFDFRTSQATKQISSILIIFSRESDSRIANVRLSVRPSVRLSVRPSVWVSA